MRLLFTLPNFQPSNFGGVVASMSQVIKHLSLRYEVRVLTTSYKLPDTFCSKFNIWLDQEEFLVKYVKTKRPLISFRYIIAGLKEIKSCDQVHLSSIFFFPNLAFACYGLLLKKKIFWSPHGELLRPALKIKYWKKFFYLIFVRVIKNEIFFRATSDEEAIQIRRVLHIIDVTVIPNFFDFKPVYSVVKKRQFLFLGRVCPIKRIENLIIACSKSKSFNKNDYVLCIAGTVDNEFKGYYTNLKKQIVALSLSEKIIFTGNLFSPEKEQLLAQSRALCLVSDSENFGNVVVEALAQGTPVIASTGTPWSILQKIGCGLWIDNSPDEIALALDTIIKINDSGYKKMCVNARTLSEKFSSNIVIEQWIKFIN